MGVNRGLSFRAEAVTKVYDGTNQANDRRTADRRRHPELKAQDDGWLRLQVWSDRRG
jgi:hypothetical protein